jgi:Family of unknown function (DUF6541)
MRLEKPALGGSAAWRNWWPAIVLAFGVLAVGLLLDGWLLGALAGTPATLLTGIAALAMFWLPGLALLRLLWPETLAPAERWPLAIGISCALPPLLLLLSSLIGLRWNTALCWGYLALSALVVAWPRPLARDAQQQQSWRPDRQHLVLIALTLAAVIVRLYAARALPVGLWGDSYQHTIMAQLLVDHGGLFSSWRPYALLTTFTYHYGFHSNVAWLHWLIGEPVAQGVILVGQLQNALAVPLIYLLTRRLMGNERAALWAALIVGFVSIMPGYYLNWGRYTQLAGQTVLPAVCVVWMALLDAARDRATRRAALLRLLGLTVLVTAGLALTHYRVAVFAACFVLAYAAYLLLSIVRTPRNAARLIGVGLAASALLLLIITPWLIRLREGALLRLGGFFLSTNIGTDLTNGLPTTGEFFSLYAKPYLVALALAGIALLIWRRHWRGLVLPACAVLLWLSANPYLIGLPGAGIISNFTVLIANYLVLAPLAGYAISAAWDWLARTLHRFVRSAKVREESGLSPDVLMNWGALLVGALVLLWGASWQQRIADPQFQLFTPADAEAMAWIRRETPPDAKFFVNSFPAFGGTLYAGSDGGWWLPFMTGRQSDLPPLTYGLEAGEQPGYQFAVNAQIAAVERQPLTSRDAVAALRQGHFSYLYDGPAAAPPQEYIDPAALATSPLYELVYHKGGVTIWRVR